MTSRRLARPAATLAFLALGIGCGPSGSTADPGSGGDPTSEPTEPTSQAMTGLPSRPVAFDHFALEDAVGSALGDADGVDGVDSTTWELLGDGVDVRMEVSSWLAPAEAQMRCQSSAGNAGVQSLAFSSPTWTTDDSVYVTQRASCVRVTVLRRQEPDVDAATAVAGLLVSPDDWPGGET